MAAGQRAPEREREAFQPIPRAPDADSAADRSEPERVEGAACLPTCTRSGAHSSAPAKARA
jgi:hypothetical protein